MPDFDILAEVSKYVTDLDAAQERNAHYDWNQPEQWFALFHWMKNAPTTERQRLMFKELPLEQKHLLVLLCYATDGMGQKMLALERSGRMSPMSAINMHRGIKALLQEFVMRTGTQDLWMELTRLFAEDTTKHPRSPDDT